MAPAALSKSKKKGSKSNKSPPSKKQKQINDLFTEKRPKKKEILDDSDSFDEDIEEQEEFDEDDSGSDILSEGDEPITDDFLQGSDGEGVMLFIVYTTFAIFSGQSNDFFCCFHYFAADSGSDSDMDAGSDSDSDESDIEKKSKRIDLKKKREEKDAEEEIKDDIQVNIGDDEFRLPTKEVCCFSAFSYLLKFD